MNGMDDSHEFISSKEFSGGKRGFYFGTGVKGTGYYGDIQSPQDEDIQDSKTKKRKILQGEELLQEVEREAGLGSRQVQEIDLKGLRKLITNLERKFNANVEQRAKYANEPKKFLDSELDLDEAVRAMNVATASGHLYPELARPDVLPIFLSLLQHENGDIVAGSIELLSELTDADAVENYEEEASILIDALIEGGLISVLVDRLRYLNESIKEEASAVYNALSVLENCIDVKPDVAQIIAETPGVLEWLCARLSPKTEVDSNKQYSSEVLAVILQSAGTQARLKFVEMDGVDRALQSVAPYRSQGIRSPEEEEFVENVFDILCAVLMEDIAKVSFVENEGIELMILVLKGRTPSRTAALKCLDFATTGYCDSCQRAITEGLLPSLFGIFMGKIKLKKGTSNQGKKKESINRDEEEVRCVSIISNLLAWLKDDALKVRVIAKFVEGEFEKCDRLMEIFSRFAFKVAEEERHIAHLHDMEEGDQEEMLLARMDAGLFTLQQCALIIGELWYTGEYGLKNRLLLLLHQQGYTLGYLRALLEEYLNALGPAEEESKLNNAGRTEIERVQGILSSLLAPNHVKEES